MATHVEACLSCSGGNETGFLWNVQNGQVQHGFSQLRAAGRGLAFSERHGTVVAQHPEKPNCTVHYATKGKPLYRCGMPEKIAAMALSPCGVHLAGGGASGKLYLWVVSTGVLLRIWDAHYKAVADLAFSRDGGHLVSGSEDASVKLWSLAAVLDSTQPASAEVRPANTSSLHTLGVTALAVGEAQGWVASTGKDRTLRVHDAVLNRDVHCCVLPSLPKCLAATKEMATFFAGCADGKIYQSDLYPDRRSNAAGAVPQAKLLAALLGHSDVANKSGAGAGELGSYHTAVFEGHTGHVAALALTDDELSLVSGGADGNVNVWQVASRQLLRSFTQHKSPITSLRLVIVPATIKSERDSQLVAPFASLKRSAATGDASEDYACVAYHPPQVHAQPAASGFADGDFGRGGHSRKRRRREAQARREEEQEQQQQQQQQQAAREEPKQQQQQAAVAVAGGEQEKLLVLAKLYALAAAQREEIARLRSELEAR